jgi:hypothetical protein
MKASVGLLGLAMACSSAARPAPEDTGGALARFSRGGAPPSATPASDDTPRGGRGQWVITEDGLGGGVYGSDELRLAEVAPTVGYRVDTGPESSTLLQITVRDPVTSVAGPAGCPPRVPVRLVWLEISHGSRTSHAVQGHLVRDACGLEPSLQLVAPIGGLLAVANRGSATDLVLTAPGGEASQKALAENSDRLLGLRQPGLFQVRAGEVAAWVVVPPSPYAATVGPDGRSELAAVPLGTFTLVVLGAPSAPGRPPREARVSVTLKPAATGPTRVTVDLPR